MDAKNQIKKNVIHLMQQFHENIGDGMPSTEQLEMYSLTLEQYQEGLALVTAELAEREKARAEKEAREREVADKEKLEEQGTPTEDDPQLVAEEGSLHVEEAFETTRKVPEIGGKPHT